MREGAGRREVMQSSHARARGSWGKINVNSVVTELKFEIEIALWCQFYMIHCRDRVGPSPLVQWSTLLLCPLTSTDHCLLHWTIGFGSISRRCISVKHKNYIYTYLLTVISCCLCATLQVVTLTYFHFPLLISDCRN